MAASSDEPSAIRCAIAALSASLSVGFAGSSGVFAASARIPLGRFASKTIYWALSGDEVPLDINAAPRIVCVGNSPKRQSIYGTALALMIAQMFKVVNVPGRRHCGILLDELPTIYLKGLDNLISTARSNNVAVVLGAQDKSQLVRDYGKKESDVIFNTVGNLFAGAVKGSTAQELSRTFGKEDRGMTSFHEGESESTSLSYQLRELLPAHRIEALSQGCFCGYVSDSNTQKIDKKIFCGEILASPAPKDTVELPLQSSLKPFQIPLFMERQWEKIKKDIDEMITRELEMIRDRS